MQNFFSIQLPRNFNFISRLPARFNMLVLSKSNQTEKGIWYKVVIGGQELNILSKRKLEIGKHYVVEKKSKLELIVKEDTKATQQSKELLSATSSADHSQAQKLYDFSSLFSLSRYDISLFTAHLISLLSVHDEQPHIEKNNDENFYFEKTIANQEISGVFKKVQDKWLLYLSLPPNFLKESNIAEELNETMFGLPVKKIFLTSKENIHGLYKGIDIFS